METLNLTLSLHDLYAYVFYEIKSFELLSSKSISPLYWLTPCFAENDCKIITSGVQLLEESEGFYAKLN
jgi:hypothetical protein